MESDFSDRGSGPSEISFEQKSNGFCDIMGAVFGVKEHECYTLVIPKYSPPVIPSIPEPGTWMMLLFGIIGILVWYKSRNKD